MAPLPCTPEPAQRGIPPFDPERSRRVTSRMFAVFCTPGPAVRSLSQSPTRAERAARHDDRVTSHSPLHLTPLECAVTSFASVTPLDSAVTNPAASISKHQTLSRAECAVTRLASVTPLECAVTGTPGEGARLPRPDGSYREGHKSVNPYSSYSYAFPCLQTLMAHTLTNTWGGRHTG